MTYDLSAVAAQPDELADAIGDARIVLLGEASHGTHEFYAERAQLTQQLIAERGFRAVAVEADWPAAARANWYVQGVSDDADAEDALGGFQRFPRWMWRNPVVRDLIEWLRDHGDGAGFYGLDLYSLRESMQAVVDHLQRLDPDAAERARRRYACFDHLDEQSYGYLTATGQKEPCEDAIVEVLRELHERAAELAGRDPHLPRDAHFVAEQNARLVVDAERYYRAMFRGRESSWNLRDTHMADTLDALRDHLGGDAKVIVWAHNSHLGDARATSMGEIQGEINVGQLMRERHGDEVCIVGFTTHAGTVTAARDWDGPAERREVRPSLGGSVERRLHDADITRALLDLRRGGVLHERALERMIGVIYRPETERQSHYVEAIPARQFDLIVHIDDTTALEPLEPGDLWHAGEAPAETYPFGL